MTKKQPIKAIKKRKSDLLSRRPHRSFRKTLRRDYKRSLKLPGYFAFSKHVRQTLWVNRKTFISLAIVYALITVLMVGIASQDNYTTVVNTLKSTSGDMFNGFWGNLGSAGLLSLTAITGGLSTSLTDSQQIYAGLIVLLTWLTTVWLLRNILAGHKVKLRDGLYNAGSPILSTFLVALLAIVQLLPLALALIAYGAATSTGLLNNGVEAMLFWVADSLLALLSVYWLSSTFFALIIVTLPGMYPYQAIKTAGDLVVGRRLRLLLRFSWMAIGILIVWGLVLIPTIIFDSWLKNVWSAVSWLPIVPVVLLAISSLTIVWFSSYTYLLYRKVIADEAGSA
ncbi:MAG: hypothetical protein WCH58_00780 [Candidatus Saccharibacteria bacterium]